MEEAIFPSVANGQLAERSDSCRALVFASPMPTAFLTGTGHTICYANPALCLLTGQTEQQLSGNSFSHAIDESRECLALLDRVYRTGQAEIHTGQEGAESPRLCWSYVIWPVNFSCGHHLAGEGGEGGAGIMVQVTETTSFHLQSVAMNQALLVGAVRQHELTEVADALNVKLEEEIFQRRNAEKELESQQCETRASELRFRGLIEAIPQIVWTATPQGTLDFANSKWFQCFGLSLEVFNAAGWSRLLHANDLDRSLDAWTAGLNSKSAFHMEHRLKDISTGDFKWYFTRAVPMCVDGSVVKWFGTSTDIDDNRRAEMAVIAQQKMESLGVLAGGIAHDFNNLLCVIQGGASIIKTSLPESHSLQGLVSDIVRASERGADLTRQMLAYAGKGQYVIEPIDINEMVQSTCDLIRASVPRSVSLTLDACSDLPAVQADLGQTTQVVMNLVLNAAEAIGESSEGVVVVTTDLMEVTVNTLTELSLVTGILTPGSYVVLSVKDNGLGMDESTKAKMLEPFFTTKFTGRGLGLSAVGGILRAQNAALEVQSTPGLGSCFRVYFPASSIPSRHRKTSSELRRIRGSGTVLVVDDEEMIRKLLKLSLEDAGFAVLLADGGSEALRILRSEASSAVSLVILDISMPCMSGRQVIEQIRLLGMEIPILICSGYSEAQIDLKFAGLDIAGFIQKPFAARQLANRVSALLRRTRERRNR